MLKIFYEVKNNPHNTEACNNNNNSIGSFELFDDFYDILTTI